MLLDGGATIDLSDSGGNSALLVAAQLGYEVGAQLLLERGASVLTANAVGETPLHAACDKGAPEVAAMLLPRGADGVARDRHGNTPIHVAAGGTTAGHYRCLRLLCARHLPVALANTTRRLPIDFARGNKEAVRLLGLPHDERVELATREEEAWAEEQAWCEP